MHRISNLLLLRLLLMQEPQAVKPRVQSMHWSAVLLIAIISSVRCHVSLQLNKHPNSPHTFTRGSRTPVWPPTWSHAHFSFAEFRWNKNASIRMPRKSNAYITRLSPPAEVKNVGVSDAHVLEVLQGQVVDVLEECPSVEDAETCVAKLFGPVNHSCQIRSVHVFCIMLIGKVKMGYASPT